MWRNFCSILNDILQIYQQMLILSNDKKDALIAVDVPRIEEITKQEEVIIIECGKLEAKRRQALMQLAGAADISGAKITLEQLSAAADPQFKDELLHISSQLNTTLTSLKKANEINTKLIEQSLALINYNMNLMTQSGASPVYAAGGKQHSDRMSGLFDKKV